MAAYPEELDREIVLRDGARVRIRPILPEDAPRLVTLYGRLSRPTAYRRFFGVMNRLPLDWARHFTHVDYRRRLALVAERALEWRPELIGVARYEGSDDADEAEVAIVVLDYWQGRGLGTTLLTETLRAGEASGVRRFRAHVLGENRRALALLARVADIEQRTTEGDVTSLSFTRRRDA